MGFLQQEPSILTERGVPPTLAGLLADLELDQPQIVSLNDLARLREKRRLRSSVRDIAQRLQQYGWLLPLRTRGMYEFAPAARAGNLSSGDSFVELRATLRRRPDLSIMVAEESSAWLHGLSTRAPEQHVISVPLDLEIPPALDAFRHVRSVTRLEAQQIDGLPVWRIETLLVMMAAKPKLYGDWPNVLDWLPAAVGRADQKLILRELSGASSATLARLAYLFHRAGNEELGQQTLKSAKPLSGPIYFGKDRDAGIYDSKYDIVDSVFSSQSRLKL